MDRPVAQRLGQCLVDETMLLEQREPVEARGLDGYLEVVAAARRDLLEADVTDAPYYERAAPFWQSYLGLRRYWDKVSVVSRAESR